MGRGAQVYHGNWTRLCRRRNFGEAGEASCRRMQSAGRVGGSSSEGQEYFGFVDRVQQASPEISADFTSFRSRLIQSFKFRKEIGKVIWLKAAQPHESTEYVMRVRQHFIFLTRLIQRWQIQAGKFFISASQLNIKSTLGVVRDNQQLLLD